MRVVLEAQGVGEGRVVDVPVGAPRTLGSAPHADASFAHDAWMSPLHVALWSDGRSAWVRDLDTPHGIRVNGVGAREASLAHGDTVQVGATLFVVRAVFEDALSPVIPAGLASRAAHVRWCLAREDAPLFVVLDAARDEMVLPWLRESGAEFTCLYDGYKGQELADVAPYLVALSGGDAALDDLVGRAWGECWGVFLTSHAGLRDVRRHLRRFLRVRVENRGPMLFRWYDPRVLRAYLPTCTLDEANAFFGPVDRYLVEGRRGTTLLRFSVTPDGVRADAEALLAAV